MTVSKRAIRKLDAPPRRPDDRPRRLRAARVEIVSDSLLSMTLVGFDKADLDLLKSRIRMAWSHVDLAWIIDARDQSELLDLLRAMRFAYRVVGL